MQYRLAGAMALYFGIVRHYSYATPGLHACVPMGTVHGRSEYTPRVGHCVVMPEAHACDRFIKRQPLLERGSSQMYRPAPVVACVRSEVVIDREIRLPTVCLRSFR